MNYNFISWILIFAITLGLTPQMTLGNWETGRGANGQRGSQQTPVQTLIDKIPNRNQCPRPLLDWVEDDKSTKRYFLLFPVKSEMRSTCAFALENTNTGDVANLKRAYQDLFKDEIRPVSFNPINNCPLPDDSDGVFATSKYYAALGRIREGLTSVIDESAAINATLPNTAFDEGFCGTTFPEQAAQCTKMKTACQKQATEDEFKALVADAKKAADKLHCVNHMAQECTWGGGPAGISSRIRSSNKEEKLRNCVGVLSPDYNDAMYSFRNVRSIQDFTQAASGAARVATEISKPETINKLFCDKAKNEQVKNNILATYPFMMGEEFKKRIDPSVSTSSNFSKSDRLLGQTISGPARGTFPFSEAEVRRGIESQLTANREGLSKAKQELDDAYACLTGQNSGRAAPADCSPAFLNRVTNGSLQDNTSTRGDPTRRSAVLLYQCQQTLIERHTDRDNLMKISSEGMKTIGLTGASLLTGGIVGGPAALARLSNLSRLARTAAGATALAGEALIVSDSVATGWNSCFGDKSPAFSLASNAAYAGNSCPSQANIASQAARQGTSCYLDAAFAIADGLAGGLAGSTVRNVSRAAATVPPPRAAAVGARNSLGDGSAPTAGTAAPTGPAAPKAATSATTPAVAPAAARSESTAAKPTTTPPAASATPATPKAADPAPARPATTEASSPAPKTETDAGLQIQRALNEDKPESYVNPQLEEAVVVRSIRSTVGQEVDGFQGFNNNGIEVLDLNGQKLFAKVTDSSPEFTSLKFERELFFSKKVESLGVGPKTYGTTVGQDGNYRIVSQLVEGTDLKVNANGSVVGDLSRVSDRTIQDIQTINQKLVNSGINPEDLQFRVDRTGRPFVVDTAEFRPLIAADRANVEARLAGQVTAIRTAKENPRPVTRGSSEVASGARDRRESVGVVAQPGQILPPSAVRANRTQSRAEIVEQYARRQATTEAQNQAWINAASKVKPDGKTIFLDVQNSSIKDLNDTTLDKDFVSGITNRQIEMTMNSMDGVVRKYRGADGQPLIEAIPYSDFKSVRYAFRPRPPATKLPKGFEQNLSKALKKSNDEFGSFVRDNKLVRETDQPSEWFRYGLGATGDQANMSSRYSRSQADNRLYRFDDPVVQKGMGQSLERAENLRTNLARELGSTSLWDKSAGRATFRTEVFEIARKAESAEDLQRQIRQTLRTTVSKSQAEKILAYSRTVDEFSPGLNIAKRENASLTSSDFGGMSLDFKGMGGQNLKETAEAISNPKSLSNAIEEARLGEAAVTNQFVARKQKIESAIQRVAKKNGLKVDIRTSGDDMVVLPSSPMSPKVRDEITQELAKTVPPSALRVSHIPKGIKASDRAGLGVRGESLEKQLRLNLQGKIPKDRLDQMLFRVDMQGRDANVWDADLQSALRGPAMTAAEKRAIDTAFANAVQNMKGTPQAPVSLARARVVQRIATRDLEANGFQGQSNDGIEILEQNGKQYFAKIIDDSRSAGSRSKVQKERIANEVAQVKALAASGLGPAFRQSFRGADGKTRIVTDFVPGTHVQPGTDIDFSKLTPAMIDDMERAGRSLIEKGVDPVDLQFRVTPGGRVFVVDPAEFSRIRTARDRELATSTLNEDIKELREGLASAKKSATPKSGANVTSQRVGEAQARRDQLIPQDQVLRYLANPQYRQQTAIVSDPRLSQALKSGNFSDSDKYISAIVAGTTGPRRTPLEIVGINPQGVVSVFDGKRTFNLTPEQLSGARVSETSLQYMRQFVGTPERANALSFDSSPTLPPRMPANAPLRIGSQVDVPRTGQGDSQGEIVRIEGDRALVFFMDGKELKQKIVPLAKLKAVSQSAPSPSTPKSYSFRSLKVGDYNTRGGQSISVDYSSPFLQKTMRTAMDGFASDGVRAVPSTTRPTDIQMEQAAKSWLKFAEKIESKNKDGLTEYAAGRDAIVNRSGGRGDLGEIAYCEAAVCRELSIFGSVAFAELGYVTRVVKGNVTGGGHAWIEFLDPRTNQIIGLVDSNYQKKFYKDYREYYREMNAVVIDTTVVARPGG